MHKMAFFVISAATFLGTFLGTTFGVQISNSFYTVQRKYFLFSSLPGSPTRWITVGHGTRPLIVCMVWCSIAPISKKNRQNQFFIRIILLMKLNFCSTPFMKPIADCFTVMPNFSKRFYTALSEFTHCLEAQGGKQCISMDYAKKMIGVPHLNRTAARGRRRRRQTQGCTIQNVKQFWIMCMKP